MSFPFFLKPLRYRRSIPFYYDKTESEFSQDPYENYAAMVTRQLRLHFATTPYPFQPITDFVMENLDINQLKTIADIGCGVGHLIGEIAQQNPTVDCYGIDYSYQLLKAANDYFIKGKRLEIDESARGFSLVKKEGLQLKNVQFALAKAEHLPFSNDSLSAICSSFTLDRFSDPLAALREMRRVLQSGGKVVLSSPLNFQTATHWSDFYPFEKLLNTIKAIGFKIEKVESEIIVKEPLDIHGNFIEWKAIGMVLQNQ